MTDDNDKPRAGLRSLLFTLARQIYIQFAAVTGALSLAALLSHIVDWQGVLLDLVEWWSGMVRPAIEFIYAPVILLMERLWAIDLALPAILQDYLAVGIVLILSRWLGATGGWKGGAGQAIGTLRRRPLGALGLLVRTLFIWPLELVGLARNALFARKQFPERSAEEILQIRLSHLIALLPVFYALALVILNWLIAAFPYLLTRGEKR